MSLNPSTYSIFPKMWSELLLWLNIIMSLSFAYARIVDDDGPLESLKQDSMKADGLVELSRTRSRVTYWLKFYLKQ